MSRQSKPLRKTVEIGPAVRPSRIRRDPPAPAASQRPVRPYPSENEVWIVAVGVILFTIAISLLTIGISQITSH